jgi:hypothetical protein
MDWMKGAGAEDLVLAQSPSNKPCQSEPAKSSKATGQRIGHGCASPDNVGMNGDGKRSPAYFYASSAALSHDIHTLTFVRLPAIESPDVPRDLSHPKFV